jgi:parvulin-like peptidyl-prolyl isomerase
MPRGPEGENQDEAAKKKEVLDRLIADKVLYQEALRQGLDKDPKIQRMMINTLLRKDVYGSVKNTDISDEELQKYFDEHKDEFIVPEKVQVKRILIKVDATTPDDQAKKKAETLLAEVRKTPDSFKDVAIRESQDAFARRGGDIGFISKEGKPGLDQKVVDEAFKLEPNSISDVFKTDEGYNIVQVVNKRERVERSFDQMKGAVLRKLKTEKSKAIQDKYIEDLKKNAKIAIDDAKLTSHQPKRAMPAMPGMPGMMGPEGMPMGAPAGLVPGAPGMPGATPGAMPGAAPAAGAPGAAAPGAAAPGAAAPAPGAAAPAPSAKAGATGG